MDGDFVEPATTRLQSQSSSHSADGRDNDAGGFECNICLDLAQDPIVTLCGHLFCWPCLYKWLHAHAHSHECPVCKAIIEKEKLVPLYGRGKNSTDPRSKSVPGIDIPQRPAGQRPETAPSADQTQFNHQDFGFMAGFPPVATARWGNVSVSSGIGGLFPSLFNFHMHGFPDASPYGMATGFPFGLSNSFHGGHAHGFPQYNTMGQQPNSYLSRLLFIVGALVIFALLWM